MTDDVVWDHGFYQRANPENPEFRERGRQTTLKLVSFLQDNDLVNRQLLAEPSALPPEFIIKFSHLNDRGLELENDGAIDRWLRANDDIRKPISMRSLERALKKIASKQ